MRYTRLHALRGAAPPTTRGTSHASASATGTDAEHRCTRRVRVRCIRERHVSRTRVPRYGLGSPVAPRREGSDAQRRKVFDHGLRRTPAMAGCACARFELMGLVRFRLNPSFVRPRTPSLAGDWPAPGRCGRRHASGEVALRRSGLADPPGVAEDRASGARRKPQCTPRGMSGWVDSDEKFGLAWGLFSGSPRASFDEVPWHLPRHVSAKSGGAETMSRRLVRPWAIAGRPRERAPSCRNLPVVRTKARAAARPDARCLVASPVLA